MAHHPALAALACLLAAPLCVLAAVPTQAEEVVQPLPDSYVPLGERIAPAEPAQSAGYLGTGEASWYGQRFAGRRTANGETFDPAQYTAAHRKLPFGSKVRVTHLRTGRSVVVRINDRGPFNNRRVIDLSRAAADELGITRSGKAQVQLELLQE